jgi:hypothetical protein
MNDLEAVEDDTRRQRRENKSTGTDDLKMLAKDPMEAKPAGKSVN